MGGQMEHETHDGMGIGNYELGITNEEESGEGIEPALDRSWRVFLMGERDRTIARLRQIERLLGMEQTVPERRR